MRTLPQPVSRAVGDFLSKKFSSDFIVKDFTPIGGGCISNGGRLTTSHGIFFIKWNDAKKYPGMFTAEAEGLKLLASADAIRVPEVVEVNENEDYQFILMEFIASQKRSTNYWELLARQLATLHTKRGEYFGLGQNNYIGSLPQYNEKKKSWIDFFVTQRLNIQLKIAFDSRAIDHFMMKNFEKLCKKLPSILTEENPSLVHGDLWGGNLHTDEIGNPCLIDPAVYFGNREVDLAMTQLFGGFANEFYEAYQEAFPLPKGAEERFDIYNLYPLLVHVNLFGQGYLNQVLSILKSFN